MSIKYKIPDSDSYLILNIEIENELPKDFQKVFKCFIEVKGYRLKLIIRPEIDYIEDTNSPKTSYIPVEFKISK